MYFLEGNWAIIRPALSLGSGAVNSVMATARGAGYEVHKMVRSGSPRVLITDASLNIARFVDEVMYLAELSHMPTIIVNGHKLNCTTGDIESSLEVVEGEADGLIPYYIESTDIIFSVRQKDSEHD